MKRIILIVPIIFLLFLGVSIDASEPTQQYNKIYLSPFYVNSMSRDNNYTYTITVSPPDHISSVISAIVSMEVWMTPSINFTILVNEKRCNTIYYYISTTYAGAGNARINFDCSNIITQEGNYTIIIKPTLANTGSSTAWLDLTYMNKPFGEMKMLGTEYEIGEYATIFLQLKDSNGLSINNGNCFLSAYYPNLPNSTHAIFLNAIPMLYLANSSGLYYYDVYTPNITGVYMLSAMCSYAYNNIWIFPEDEAVRKSNRTVSYGSYIGDTLFLNSKTDWIYTRCSSSAGATKQCEATYSFYAPELVEINITDSMVFYSGETTAIATLTTYIWNWSSSSWVTLNNTLTFSGTATSEILGVDDLLTNSFPIDCISANGTINIRLSASSGNTFTEYDNWLSLKFISANGTITDIKGSGEMHISNLSAKNISVNINPEQVWGYYNRTLTDYNQSGIFNWFNYINNTMNLQYNNLYSLMVSVNNSIINQINSVNATINANIEAVNSSIWGKLFSIQSELQDIQNNLTLIYNLIGSVNTTIMNKLYAIQDEIANLNESIINGLLNVTNMTVNITTNQEEVLGMLVAFGGDSISRKSYAYMAFLPFGGLGEENALWACKDNETLARYSVKNLTGSLNKTYILEETNKCTYGCEKNACIIPQYLIWLYILIIIIVMFYLYVYFTKEEGKNRFIWGAFIILIVVSYVSFINALNFDITSKVILYLPALVFLIVFMFIGLRSEEAEGVGGFPYF